ncbi:MAG: hypothetical protein ED556_03285 [Winogradskyella sp.]|uniref:hypothetical protein n=1 Tax=Winogradskyella sp. TaxID=1883156 RepID=UPI000F3D01CA|nr:hypothetical protein [Winogradskyella sp.]RNC88221.1 MAG: hypothetical protein ED556_03285 [Winogradskyella sp.]
MIGLLVQIITFPGIIFDQFSNKLACDLLEVKVHEVKYLQSEAPISYIIHDIPESYFKIFSLSIIPFMISTLTAILLFTIGYSFGEESIIFFIFCWLGISVAAHAFPNKKNGSLLWQKSISEVKAGNYIALLGFPLVVIIYLAQILHYVWLDIIYGFILLMLVVEPFFK